MFARKSKSQNNTIIKIVSLSLSCLLVSTSMFAEFTQFDATYRAVLKNESTNTVINLTQNQNNGVYAYNSYSKLSGIFGKVSESSVFTFSNNKVKPTFYQHDSDDDKQINYNWRKNQATSRIKKGRKKINLKGMELDVLSMQMQISRDLKNDSLALSYRVIEDNGLKTYSVFELGEDTFEFDGRTLKTIKLEQQRTHSKIRKVLWFAPELDYLLVKMQELENDQLNDSLDLISYNNLSPLPIITEPAESESGGVNTFAVPATTS